MNIPEILSRNILFKGINAKDIELLLNRVTYQLKKPGKEELLASEGEQCKALMLLLEGAVRGEMMGYSGKVLKIEDIKAGRPLAVAFLFGTENVYPVNIITNQPSVILSIRKTELLKLFQISTVLLNNYLNLISNRAQFLSRKIKFLSFSTIREKMLQFLLQHGVHKDGFTEIKQTQQEMADLFGVTRPSLARIITQMEEDGVIRTDKRRYMFASNVNRL